jgi:SAM-dependent methyltransferase
VISDHRFRFGDNWRSFVRGVTEAHIAEAENGLRRLFPGNVLAGARFLDIGCGSGLSSLAALRLGAAYVEGVDLDQDSVEAARALLAKFAPQARWSVRQADIFDLRPNGPYDVVYAWGVLHHTGDLWAAVERTQAMVPMGGRLAIALYRRTPLCGAWKRVKARYAAGSASFQAAARVLYKTVYCAGLVATGRVPRRYIAAYKSARGMDWHHDVHDWLGGYPYESTTPEEVCAFAASHGLAIEHMFTRPPVAFGLFGSHCDEFVGLRVAPPPALRTQDW